MISVREALNNAMRDAMIKDDRVFIIGEEVGEYNGAYKVTQGLLDEFGSNRVIDTPITEAGLAGLAIGAAFAGLKPILEFMTFNFSLQAADQIMNSAAKTRYMSGGQIGCPIVFRGPNGSAAQVGAQHSQCFASLYSHCPGLIVVSPSCSNSAYHLLMQSIDNPNPVIFLEHEILYNLKFEKNEEEYKIGKAKVLKEGSDITVISFSYIMTKVLEVARNMNDISVEVIDISTLSPLDMDTIHNSVRKTGRVLIVEEGYPYASVGDEIISEIVKDDDTFSYLDHQPRSLSSHHIPMPYGVLESINIPDTILIDKTIRGMVW